MREMLEKLTVWFFFGVLLSLVPVVIDGLRATIAGGAFSFSDAMGKGELALITAALCGGALGELFGVGGNEKIAKIIAGGSTVVLFFFCALY